MQITCKLVPVRDVAKCTCNCSNSSIKSSFVQETSADMYEWMRLTIAGD